MNKFPFFPLFFVVFRYFLRILLLFIITWKKNMKSLFVPSLLSILKAGNQFFNEINVKIHFISFPSFLFVCFNSFARLYYIYFFFFHFISPFLFHRKKQRNSPCFSLSNVLSLYDERIKKTSWGASFIVYLLVFFFLKLSLLDCFIYVCMIEVMISRK